MATFQSLGETMQRGSIGVLAFALILGCGSGKKDESKGKDENAAKGPAVKGAFAKEGSGGPTSSLFGGKVGSILGGGKAMSQGDLTNVFAKSAAPSMTPASAPANGSAAQATTASANLWAYAPANAAFGIVVGDGTADKLANTLTEVKRVLEAHPVGAMVVKQLSGKAQQEIGVDPFDPIPWARTAGIDVTKGAAMFASSTGDVVVVLPVTDAAAFEKAIKDTDGKLGPQHCVMAEPGRYVCGKELASAQAAATKPGSPLAKRVAQLPPWLRGDVELVAHLASFPGAMKELTSLRPALETIGTIALAATMDHGSLALRGWLEGKRGGPVGQAFAATPPAALTGEASGAINWFHLRMPMDLIMGMIPAFPPAPVDIKNDLFGNLTGEIVTYSRGKTFLSENITFGLKDGARAAKVIDFMCGEVAKAKLLKGFKTKAGACTGKADLATALAKTPVGPFAAGMPAVPMLVQVEGNTLQLKIGWPSGPAGKAGDLAGSDIARELMTGDWNAVWWGMALDPLAVAPKVLDQRVAKVLGSLSEKDRQGISLVRWLYGHLYDAGMAFALRDDGIYGLAQITTFAADPPPAYAAHEAALHKLIANDFDGYRAAVAENMQLRGTLTGRHAATVKGGASLLGQAGPWGLFLGYGMVVNAQKQAAPPAVRRAP